jgi:carbon-monoxide dehydrogenase small subunit
VNYPVTLTVNGRELRREVEPRVLLLDFLRDELGLTGARAGCDTSSCGACTVMLDGKAVKSCTRLAVQADGSSVLTIEGLAASGSLHPLQEAFLDGGAAGCGFCAPGMILAAKELLDASPEPTRDDITGALEAGLCRCTGYRRIVDAVAAAAAARGAGGHAT